MAWNRTSTLSFSHLCVFHWVCWLSGVLWRCFLNGKSRGNRFKIIDLKTSPYRPWCSAVGHKPHGMFVICIPIMHLWYGLSRLHSISCVVTRSFGKYECGVLVLSSRAESQFLPYLPLALETHIKWQPYWLGSYNVKRRETPQCSLTNVLKCLISVLFMFLSVVKTSHTQPALCCEGFGLGQLDNVSETIRWTERQGQKEDDR